ncbi:MAG: hypothetical protein AB2814_06245 [Candidatus Sedimenticola endophacoides]
MWGLSRWRGRTDGRAVGASLLPLTAFASLSIAVSAGTVAGKLVNISGRQRTLSQRIAKIYLLETWGLGSAM